MTLIKVEFVYSTAILRLVVGDYVLSYLYCLQSNKYFYYSLFREHDEHALLCIGFFF